MCKYRMCKLIPKTIVSVTIINLILALNTGITYRRNYVSFTLYVLKAIVGVSQANGVICRVSQCDLSTVYMMINDVTTRRTGVLSFIFFAPFFFFLSTAANQLVTLEWRYISWRNAASRVVKKLTKQCTSCQYRLTDAIASSGSDFHRVQSYAVTYLELYKWSSKLYCAKLISDKIGFVTHLRSLLSSLPLFHNPSYFSRYRY